MSKQKSYPDDLLHLAEFGYWNRIFTILGKPPEEKGEPNQEIGKLLCYAAHQNNREAVEHLLQFNPDRSVTIKIGNEKVTAICYALLDSHTQENACLQAFLQTNDDGQFLYPPSDGDPESYEGTLLTCVILGWSEMAAELARLPNIAFNKCLASTPMNLQAQQSRYSALALSERNRNYAVSETIHTAYASCGLEIVNPIEEVFSNYEKIHLDEVFDNNDARSAAHHAQHFVHQPEGIRKAILEKLLNHARQYKNNWDAVIAYALLLPEFNAIEVQDNNEPITFSKPGLLERLLSIAALQNNGVACAQLIAGDARIAAKIDGKYPVEFTIAKNSWRMRKDDGTLNCDATLALLPQPITNDGTGRDFAVEVDIFDTALLTACKNSEMIKAEAILSARQRYLDALGEAQITVPEQQDDFSPLHWALFHKANTMTTALLEAGFDPNLIAPNGKHPLDYAIVDNDNIDAAVLLGRYGASISMNSLIAAGIKGHWASIQAFLGARAAAGNDADSTSSSSSASSSDEDDRNINERKGKAHASTSTSNDFSLLFALADAMGHEGLTVPDFDPSGIASTPFLSVLLEEVFWHFLIHENDADIDAQIRQTMNQLLLWSIQDDRLPVSHLIQHQAYDDVASSLDAFTAMMTIFAQHPKGVIAQKIVFALNHFDENEYLLTLAKNNNWADIERLFSQGSDVTKDKSADDVAALITLAQVHAYTEDPPNPEVNAFLTHFNTPAEADARVTALLNIYQYFKTALETNECKPLSSDKQARRVHFMEALPALLNAADDDFSGVIGDQQGSATNMPGGFIFGVGNSNTYGKKLFKAFTDAIDDSDPASAKSSIKTFIDMMETLTKQGDPTAILLTDPGSYLKEPVASRSDVAGAILGVGVFDGGSESGSDSDDDLTMLRPISDKDKALLKEKGDAIFDL